MRFDEVRSWYAEPERYLGGLVCFFMAGIVFLTWQFLMPSYSALREIEQQNQSLRLIPGILHSTIEPSQKTTIELTYEQRFFIKTDQTSNFLQGFSNWIEKQKISVEQLTSASEPEGLVFQLRCSGNFAQVFDFLIKFNQIPLLVTQIKLRINWPEFPSNQSNQISQQIRTVKKIKQEGQVNQVKPGALRVELSALVHRSEQGQFNWNFTPYVWTQGSSFQDRCLNGDTKSWHYRGWASLLFSEPKGQSVISTRLSNWIYRENACSSHEWVNLSHG